jgi:hypothetical protein
LQIILGFANLIGDRFMQSRVLIPIGHTLHNSRPSSD